MTLPCYPAGGMPCALWVSAGRQANDASTKRHLFPRGVRRGGCVTCDMQMRRCVGMPVAEPAQTSLQAAQTSPHQAAKASVSVRLCCPGSLSAAPCRTNPCKPLAKTQRLCPTKPAAGARQQLSLLHAAAASLSARRSLCTRQPQENRSCARWVGCSRDFSKTNFVGQSCHHRQSAVPRALDSTPHRAESQQRLVLMQCLAGALASLVIGWQRRSEGIAAGYALGQVRHCAAK